MRRILASRTRPAVGGFIAFALFAIAAILYSTGGGARQHIAIVCVLNGIMVVASQIFGGNSGVLSFGHVGLASMGAYVSAILSTPASVKATTIGHAPLGLAHIQLSVPLSILVAVIFTTAVAALLGIAVCRMHGVAGSIVTFAILMVTNSILVNWKGVTGGAEAFYGIPVRTTLVWALLGLFVTVMVGRLFMYSRVGLRVRAAREDELSAGATGVGVHRARYIAFVVSAPFAGLGGALIAHLLGAISPSEFGETLMFLQMAMLVLGGMYSITGALLGTAVVTVASEAMRWLGDGPKVGSLQFPVIHGLSSMVYGAIILVVMIWWSGGFLDDKEVDDGWTWWKRRRTRLATLTPVLATESAGVVPPPARAIAQATASASLMTGGLGTKTAAPAPAPAAPVRARSATPLLTVRDASMVFAGLRAVTDASLEVYPGEIVGLIGPNGAGKTTLLNMISGLYTATSGKIELQGQDITNLAAYRIARLGVARTFQNVRLFPYLSVRENVETAARVAEQYRSSLYRHTEDILTQFGLKEVEHRKASTLPYGLQRQVEMARGVALSPELLLLDEPAAGTNDIESMQLADSIRRVRDLEGCAILLIDHDLPFVLNLCERLYVLDAGVVIAEGTPQEIQDNPKVKEAYLGTRPIDGKTSAAHSKPVAG